MARPRTRTGTTLVETAVGLGLGLLVLGIAMVLWTTAARLGSRTDDVADDVTQAAALYMAVCKDVGRAHPGTLALDGDGAGLQLVVATDSGGAEVYYRLEGGEVVRTASGHAPRSYPLPTGSSWRLELVPTFHAAMPGYLFVAIETGAPAPWRGIVFEAATAIPGEGDSFDAWNPRPAS